MTSCVGLAIALSLAAGWGERFQWNCGPPVLEARAADGWDWISVKDPSIVRYEDKYLTLIEAQNGYGWRYYKAYVAGRLDGDWQPLAAGREDAFASMRNVTPTADRWTDVVSHIEVLRSGCDQKLEADPENLRFVFQGVLEKDRQGKAYGQIPWKLGVMEPTR